MDLTAKKSAFATQMVALADELLLIAQKIDEISACYSVNSFSSGGMNQFANGDFTTTNVQLNAQIVADVMYVVNLLQSYLDVGKRNSLRECLAGPLP